MKTKTLIKIALIKTPVLNWLSYWWWTYLLAKPDRTRPYCTRWHRFWCRAALHPEGVWWYSNGFEPDMHCRGCDDDLG